MKKDSMVRINTYIRQIQLYQLKTLSGDRAEHIRTALDEYLERKLNASLSKSKTKNE